MDGDTSGDNFDLAAPDPAALVESLRAFGYTPQTAVADLIDNSITATADRIWIEFDWDGADSRIAIGDNGLGMTEAELKQAMRPGSMSPQEKRAVDDLGRFGLGLKTASFSQCRELTVITKTKADGVHARQWDLDTVVATHEWRLLHGYPENCADLAERLDAQPRGTVVVWQHLDRIVGTADVDDEDAHRRFLELARSVRSHLSMTFHRFLAPREGRTVTVNDHEVPPWDPFLSRSRARQVLAAEELPLAGGKVVVQPVVLPHRSKLTAEEFELASGERGWNSLQGFYVYRNKRLLVAGDWLGLGFQKEEHYKLARIQVDIANEMDALWQIDVRKSMAQPPGVLRAELRRVAKVTRVRAVEVYRHRGKILTRQKEKGLSPAWLQLVMHGKVSYQVNRDHPAVVEAIEHPSAQNVRNLLKIVEGTIPIPLISIASAERPEEQAGPFEGVSSNEVSTLATALYKSLRGRGEDHVAARDRVLTTDPFQYFPELYEVLDTHDEQEAGA
ncbi:ATP-binding protein [Mycolicibacterium lacusdiani]|uniref:ATP-binding protein n=1 Tax=Mycolicibacterium lacusdiani TaxID=2895283 RepID=UPI001F42C119|nr:ATP-binding protein [Mycolicibacterium lacusdiani]